MSDLTNIEKRELEKLFGMGSGYVQDFSNRTFDGFVFDSTGKSICDSKYDGGSGSKANRLRAFWCKEPNCVGGSFLKTFWRMSKNAGSSRYPVRVLRFLICARV